MAAILNFSKKMHLPWVDFGGLFYLDIWYPKEHVSSGMALITFFSNQNLLLTELYGLFEYFGFPSIIATLSQEEYRSYGL